MVTGPVQPWREKIGVGTIVADLMVTVDVPTLLKLMTLVTVFEFNRAVPKLIVVGTADRPAADDGVPALAPLHAVRSNDRAKVSKRGRKTKRWESGPASLFSGEHFISGLRSLWIVVGYVVEDKFPRMI
jgi:hypothetical protein